MVSLFMIDSYIVMGLPEEEEEEGGLRYLGWRLTMLVYQFQLLVNTVICFQQQEGSGIPAEPIQSSDL